MVRLGGIGTADVGGSSPAACSSSCPRGACRAVTRRSAERAVTAASTPPALRMSAGRKTLSGTSSGKDTD